MSGSSRLKAVAGPDSRYTLPVVLISRSHRFSSLDHSCAYRAQCVFQFTQMNGLVRLAVVGKELCTLCRVLNKRDNVALAVISPNLHPDRITVVVMEGSQVDVVERIPPGSLTAYSVLRLVL